MADWPATLPAFVSKDSLDEAFPDMTIRTGMDVGPPKMRRRTTAAVRPIACSQVLTAAQVADLDAFYSSTLAGGSLAFTWVHPRTRAAATLRFTAPPRVSSRPNSNRYVAAYQLEVLP